MTDPAFEIAGRRIGPGAPAYVVAELSANHGQDLETARDLVRAAAQAGADAIKLQTYTPDTITIRSDEPVFRIGTEAGTLWDGRQLHDLYSEAQTPWDWHPLLSRLAGELGLHCFSSPFDSSSVDFLEKMGVPAYKVASFELVDIPLLEKVAETHKPVILSTGMAGLEEIDEAVECLRSHGAGPIALLRASSAYPAPPDEINLRAIRLLANRFGCVVGLSDHTLGIAVPVAAVALGAHIVEKHLTLSRERPGPDSAFSLEPHEFAQMVEAIRIAERALGDETVGPTPRESSSLAFRRSLFVAADVPAGARFTPDNLRSIRPAAGLHTRHLGGLLGCRAARDIRKGTPMAWQLVAPQDRVGAECHPLAMRRACSEDCEILFDWVNDPVRRRMSFVQAPVSRQEHESWFAARMRDPQCKMYMVVDAGGSPIGEVRFELEAGEGVVSTSIGPSHRGRRHGTAALHLAVREAREVLRLRRIVALVKPENAASIRACTSAGFGAGEEVSHSGVPALRMTVDFAKNAGRDQAS